MKNSKITIIQFIQGGWTFAFKDYHDLNITRNVDSYGIFAMQKVVDPASKLQRLFQ